MDDLQGMLSAGASGQHSKRNLLLQLEEGSEFLENQKEDMIRIRDKFRGKVVSFYETKKSPSLVKVILYAPARLETY